MNSLQAHHRYHLRFDQSSTADKTSVAKTKAETCGASPDVSSHADRPDRKRVMEDKTCHGNKRRRLIFTSKSDKRLKNSNTHEKLYSRKVDLEPAHTKHTKEEIQAYLSKYEIEYKRREERGEKRLTHKMFCAPYGIRVKTFEHWLATHATPEQATLRKLKPQDYSPEDKLHHIKAQRSSRLSQAAYCSAQIPAINLKRFESWLTRRKAIEAAVNERKSALVKKTLGKRKQIESSTPQPKIKKQRTKIVDDRTEVTQPLLQSSGSNESKRYVLSEEKFFAYFDTAAEKAKPVWLKQGFKLEFHKTNEGPAQKRTTSRKTALFTPKSMKNIYDLCQRKILHRANDAENRIGRDIMLSDKEIQKIVEGVAGWCINRKLQLIQREN